MDIWVISFLIALCCWACIIIKKDIAIHIGVGGILILSALWITWAFYTYTPLDPVYTGEIIKFYANGTGLLDNGTLINLSDVPGWGCGP